MSIGNLLHALLHSTSPMAVGNPTPNTDRLVEQYRDEEKKTTPTMEAKGVSVYSYLGSPLQLVLDDRIADGFNRFHDAFIQAQANHKRLHGREWSPEEPLLIDTAPDDHAAFDYVGSIVNALSEANGGSLDITVEQCTSDHLEKV